MTWKILEKLNTALKDWVFFFFLDDEDYDDE